MGAHSKEKSRRAGVHHVVGKVENKWSGRFPNSEVTQISKWQYHACLALSWSSYGSDLSSQGVREGDMQKEQVRERKYRQSWLSTNEKKRRGSIFTFWNYKFYATLDPTTGISPLELKLYKFLKTNILKKTHLKTARRSVLCNYEYTRLRSKALFCVFLVLFAILKILVQDRLNFSSKRRLKWH